MYNFDNFVFLNKISASIFPCYMYSFSKIEMKLTSAPNALLILVFLLAGCAAGYKPINPQSIHYPSYNLQNGINFSYKYDVLGEQGNKKYAKKEVAKGIRIVAVSLTNNSDSAFNVGTQVEFFAGSNRVFLMDPMDVKNAINQNMEQFLPYLLISFGAIKITNGGSSKVYPIGLIFGPILTLDNMVTAASANKKLLEELIRYNLSDKIIRKGETVYGIISFQGTGYDPVSIKLKN